MNVQHPKSFAPDRTRSGQSALHPRLHVRLRQRLRDRGAARRAADRPQLAAEVHLRALRGAALGLALHRAALDQRALLALSHPPEREAFGRFRKVDGLLRTAPAPRGRRADRAHALGPDADPEGEAHLRRRPAHDDHRGRRRHAGRHGRASLLRHPLHGGRVLLQRGRRAAVRAAGGRLRLCTEFGVIDIEPGEIA